jgi:hypothetical protein
MKACLRKLKQQRTLNKVDLWALNEARKQGRLPYDLHRVFKAHSKGTPFESQAQIPYTKTRGHM